MSRRVDAQGDYLGKHAWDDDILRECGGEWMFTSYADLRALILSVARANGANILFGTKVESVDEDEAKLILENGEVFSADVVVGADGSRGVMRDMIFEGAEQTQDTGAVVFK
jgi:salicylate hydroxylase